MGPKKTAAAVPSVLNGITVQTSISGTAIPLGWGTFRCSANLLWYGAFTATAVNSSTGGGKGGASKSATKSYTYTASVVMGVCAGPITGIRTVYVGQNIYVENGEYVNGVYQSETGTPLQQAGLSLATGALAQAPWDYLTTNFPSQAIGYSGIAYCYAAGLALDSSGALGNYSFEVVSTLQAAGSDDANPADIVNDFLPRIPFWTSGLIADLTDYGLYCTEVGLLLSPVLDTQRTAHDLIAEILQATNSDGFTSGGQLKIVPYGDTAVGSWTPNLTPQYDLTNDHFIPQAHGEDPVLVDIKRSADSWNYIQVEYRDRANNYNSQIAIGFDSANIAQYGRMPNTSPFSLHSICDPAVASKAAQLIVQRSANVRHTYKFTLPGNFDLLEPMDLVTLTSGDLDHVLVRITSVSDKADKTGPQIDFEAEEMLVGTGHAASQSGGGWGGYVPDYNINPGGVGDTALINPNRTLTHGDYEVWLGAAAESAAWGGAQIWTSTDGTNYGYSGVDIVAPGRIGVLTAALPATADPDTTDTLAVDLSSSKGVLLSATDAEADNAVTLCLIDQELIAYGTATLTGANTYHLTYLRRGLYGTTVAAHASGADFVRLDSAIANLPYLAQNVGTTLHIKFLSFNIYGNSLQDISTATDHTVVLSPGAAPIIDIISTDTQNVGGTPSSTVIAALNTAITDISSLTDTVTALTSDIQDQAAAALQLAVNSINLKKYTDLIAWVGQTPVATAVVNETTARIDGDTAIVETINIIGVKDPSGTSFILNDSSVQIQPGVTFATYTSNIVSSFSATNGNVAANTTAITNEAYTRATADTATANLISLIGASTGGGTAFLFSSSTAQVSPGQSLGSYISGVSASLGANSTAITNESIARVNGDSANATAITAVSTTVSGHTAQISSLLSSVNGLDAQWVLSLNSNGNIAGLILADNSTTSSFVIVANDLIFSDSSGGSLTSPFYISGGVVYADSLVVQTLRANSIITANIQVGQVTQLGSATFGGFYGSGVGSYVLVASAGITLTDTTNCFVQVNWQQAQSGGSLHWGYYIQIDGTTVASGTANLAQLLCCGGWAETLATGYHQVDFYWYGDTSTLMDSGVVNFYGGMR